MGRGRRPASAVSSPPRGGARRLAPARPRPGVSAVRGRLSRLVRTRPAAGRGVRLAAPPGPQRHRPLGLRGDGQRRVDAEVGRDRRAVDDVQARVAPDPVVAVDDAGSRVGADRARRRGSARSSAMSSDLAELPPGEGRHADASAQPAAAPASPRGRPGSRSGSGSPWPCREVSPSRPSRPRRPETCSELSTALHDQADDRALGPAAHATACAANADRVAHRPASQRTAAAAAAGRRRRPGSSRAGPSRWSPCRSGPFSMWVSSSGWNDDVIATPRVKSTSRGTVRVIAPPSASELVRVSCAEPRARAAAARRCRACGAAASGCPTCRPRAPPGRRVTVRRSRRAARRRCASCRHASPPAAGVGGRSAIDGAQRLDARRRAARPARGSS